MPGGIPSSVCALFLSPCPGGLVGLLRMWSGGEQGEPLPSCSLLGRVSVGAVDTLTRVGIP